jgi:hypothetical protein
LPLNQARAEIAAALEREKRRRAIKTLFVDLCARAKRFGPDPPVSGSQNFWVA